MPPDAIIYQKPNRRDVNDDRQPNVQVLLDFVQYERLLPAHDCQVRDDLGEPPSIWRSLRPPFHDGLSQSPERLIGQRS